MGLDVFSALYLYEVRVVELDEDLLFLPELLLELVARRALLHDQGLDRNVTGATPIA